MNRITLRQLNILIDTEEGFFGTEIPFQEGLNILRAKNTRGKSSTINSILYVLGIEEMLGGRNAKTMKPALKDKLIFKAKEISILESKVQLEISNHRGEIVTLTRWIKSSNFSERLIRVHDGPQLTDLDKGDFKDFYVHMSGSATENLGFHKYLTEFLGWNLPEVPTYDGKDSILYVQTLFPLFFVEQIRGWNSFYSPIKGSFGIRNLSKRAFEFLLNMDVIKNTKEREELKITKALITNKWSNLMRDYEELAVEVKGKVPQLFEKPSLSQELSLDIYDGNKNVVSISDRMFEVEALIKEKENYNVVTISEVETEYEVKIKDQENLVLQLQNELNSQRQYLNLEINNKQAMQKNLENLKKDLKQNQEAEKLYKLGSNVDSKLSKAVCPTCNQKVEDSLIPMETNVLPLNLSENIKFIKDQINTLKFGVEQSQNVILNNKSKLVVITEHLDSARKGLRLYKSELSGNPKLPTKKDLNELVQLKILFNKLNESSNSFEKIERQFDEIKEEWSLYLSRNEALSKEYFSKLDNKKLDYFEKNFLILLSSFNYSSTSTQEIVISKERYSPMNNDFDIKFDSSASDNIRLIWSYVIAIYKTSKHFSGNHPGIMIFDEPGQQQMAITSQKKLFEILSQMRAQSIIGTSLDPDEIIGVTDGLNLNVIDLGEDYIIKPLM